VGGLTSALTLLAMNWSLTVLVDRFPGFERWMVGPPVVLVRDTEVQWETMHKEGVSREELLAGLREHGVGTLDKVQTAMLEADGSISVIVKDTGARSGRSRRPGIRGLHRTQ